MSSSAIESSRKARRAVVLCLATTAIVAITELSIGLVFNLISVLAEGLHTSADLLDSVVAFLAVTFAAQPPDEQHPYGHGKYDSLAGIFEGLCVVASGLWALFASGRVLLGFAEAEAQPGPLVLVAMGAASVLYWLVSRYVLKVAEETGSPAVYAEGQHFRTHVYVTVGLFVSVGVSWLATLGNWPIRGYVDPAAALVLGGVLIYVGIKISRGGYRQIIDTALPPEELDQITASLDEFRREFVEVHAIRTRQAGSVRHIDIHLVVRGDMSVADAHDLSHRIEQRVREALPGTQLLVHVEPADGEMIRRYDDHGHSGRVIRDEPESTDREATHHHRDDAHKP